MGLSPPEEGGRGELPAQVASCWRRLLQMGLALPWHPSMPLRIPAACQALPLHPSLSSRMEVPRVCPWAQPPEGITSDLAPEACC